MKRILGIIIFIFSSFLFSGDLAAQDITCREIVSKLLDSIKNIKTQRCDVKSIENSDGSMNFSESFIKLNTKPKKIYYKNVIKGNELLWVHGENNGDAIVHARSLPFMNLNLDPYGSLMRRENHHVIFDLGFQYIGSIVANTIVNSPDGFENHFTYTGTVVWNKISCYKVIISFPEYQYIDYKTKEGETAVSIANKFSTSDYKIRLKNGLSSYYGAIKEGTQLTIPTPYAQKVVLFIDKKTYLPISVKIFDEAGLFESYEFYNVKINIPFAEGEFKADYKDYGF